MHKELSVKSRVRGDFHARFCERVRVKLPRTTRPCPLHVFNSQGQVYLQRRPLWKDIQPGKWDTAVGGHIDYGESPSDALRREVREELGIKDFTPVSIGKYVFESQRERELVYVNSTIYDGEISPSSEELDGGRFWTFDENPCSHRQGCSHAQLRKRVPPFFPHMTISARLYHLYHPA